LEFEGEQANRELGRVRAYVELLARLQVGAQWQGKLDLSGVIQQTLLEAHQAWAKLRREPEPKQAAWLRRALANNLADELRRLRRQRRDVGRERSLEKLLDESSRRVGNWLAGDATSPTDIAERHEQAIYVAEALARLPESQRSAVELRHLKGLAVSDVAAELGCSRSAVVGLLNRGVRKLRELLEHQREK
jgi:RNA polymerase sigma-70 factor (ECF subfamily)